MATVTKTIGTIGRDYSTITLWEADLDDSGIYSAADDAVGECYNDSAFNEKVTINGGGTIGLNGIHLTAAVGERHDGTAGTGVRNVPTINISPAAFDVFLVANNTTKLSWIEYDGTSTPSWDSGAVRMVFSTTTPTQTVNNCILHDIHTAATTCRAIDLEDNVVRQIFDNIIYKIDQDGTDNTAGRQPLAIIALSGTAATSVHNNTIWSVNDNWASGTRDCYGIIFPDTTNTLIQNNIIVDVTHAGSGAADCFVPTTAPTDATATHNLSSDTTATGTGSLTSKTAANQFVSTTGGSEDLHLKTGADAIDAGTDLGTTPSGVQFDIDNRDRDTEADTWDMGADEFVVSIQTATLAAVAIGNATITTISTFFQIMSATSVGVATITTLTFISQFLSAVATGVVSMTANSAFVQLLTAAASGVTAFVRETGKILTNTVSGIPGISIPSGVVGGVLKTWYKGLFRGLGKMGRG